jgi:hypothetical protein
VSTDNDLEALVKRAGQIVKDLPATIQGEAFNRVYETLAREGGLAAGTADQGSGPPKQSLKKKKTTAAKTPKKRTGGKRTTKRARPAQLRDLNLHPKEKPSLSDFVKEKVPASDHEKKLVAVYYLTRVLELDGVTVDHVYSCFRDQGWKVPNDLLTGLRLTANKKAWIDTSDSSAITVAIPGENHVEYDMPNTKSES